MFPWNQPSRSRYPPKLCEPLLPPERRKTEHQELQEASRASEAIIAEKDETIEELRKEIVVLKAEKVEAFGLKRYMGSDPDIRFYTGLPSYVLLMAIFHFVEPLVNQLNYRSDSKITAHHVPTRRRSLPPIDEFFMTLVRLRLGLLEQDLAHRFNSFHAILNSLEN